MEITYEQTTEIRNYLSSKKLPLDVIIELEDHFFKQIEIEQEQNGTTFQDAFLKTKIEWQKDLKMVRKSIFSLRKVPIILKNIQNESTRKLLKKSLYITFSLFIFQLVTAKFLLIEFYFLLNSLVYLAIGICIFEVFFRYVFSSIKQKRTRAEQFFYTQLVYILVCYVLLRVIGVFADLPTNSMKIVEDFVNGTFAYSPKYFFLATVNIFFTYFTTIYLLSILNDRSKSIKKVRKYQLQND